MFFKRKPRPTRPAPRKPACRPGLETLEDRTAPAVFALDPTLSATVNTAFGQQLQVLVTDAQGQPEAGVRVDYSLQPGAGGAGAALAAGSTLTRANGVATLPVTANQRAGTYTVMAQAEDGDAESAQFTLTNTAGAPVALAAADGNFQTSHEGGSFAPMTVLVTDAFGNPVPGVLVVFDLGPKVLTGPNGEASAQLDPVLAINFALSRNPITAGILGGSISVPFYLGFSPDHLPPSALQSVTAPSQPIVGQSLPPLAVRVTNFQGIPLSNALVVFSVQAGVGGAGATLSPTTSYTDQNGTPVFTKATSVVAGPSSLAVYTDENGIAPVAVTANAIVGPYNVTASMPDSAVSPLTISLSNASAVPAHVTLVRGAGQSATVGTPFAQPLEVRVTDTANNPVAGAEVTLTSQPGANGAGVVLSSQLLATNSAGVAAVTATANVVSGAFTVSAAMDGLDLVSFDLTNLPGPAVTFVEVPPGTSRDAGTGPLTAAVGTAFAPVQFRFTDALGNPVPNVPVSFAVQPNTNGASAALSTPTAVSGPDGTVSVTLTANTVPGSFTLTATPSDGLTPVAVTLTNTPGAAAALAVAGGSPQTTATAAPFPTPLSVRATDTFGNPVPGATVHFRVTSGSGVSLPVQSLSATTDANGLAAVQATATGSAGVSIVTATVAGVAAGATFQLGTTFNAVGGLGASGGAAQVAPVNQPFAAPLQVLVTDQFGNPLQGALVTYTVQAGAGGPGATLSSGVAASDANGFAAITAVANGSAGLYAVTAAVPGTPFTTTFHLTNLSAAPAAVTVIQGSGQAATVGAAFATPLQVRVTDAAGNPIANVPVSFADAGNGASAALSSASVITGPDGTASVAATANIVAGTYTVTATAAGLAPASFALTNVAGAPVALSQVLPPPPPGQGNSPPAAVVGRAFAPLVFRATDAFGNPVAGVPVTFAVQPAAGGASATLSPSTATTAADGTVSVTPTANTVPGSYTLTAAAPGLPTVTVGLNNLTGAAAAVTLTGGSPQTAGASTAFANPLSVRVTDAFGNPVQGATVTFRLTAGAVSLSAGSVFTDASGSASVRATAGGATGPAAVTATVAGVTAGATFQLATTFVSVAGLGASAGNPQRAVVNQPFTTPLQVFVSDQFGNPLQGALVLFTVRSADNGAGAALSATLATSDANGFASVQATANGVAGSYTVAASVPGSTAPVATFTLANLAAPDTVTVVQGSGQRTSAGLAFPTPLQVRVTDASGLPVAGVPVTFTVQSKNLGAGARLSTPVAVTDANGLASVQATANSGVGTYSVTAALASALAPAQFALENVSHAPTAVTVVQGSGQTATINTAFATPLRVRVTDVLGNPVAGVTVTFAGPLGLVRLSAAAAVTDANGVATVQATAGGLGGSYQVQAGVSGLTAAVFNLTNTAVVRFPNAQVTAARAGQRSELTGTVQIEGTTSSFFLTVDWGDGTTVTSRTFPNNLNARTVHLFHTYAQPGTYTIRVHWQDDQGTGNSTTLQVVVLPRHPHDGGN